ncbi:MAG: V8-like Glu-specific endopeptidase [Bradymonadia bacterium]|jgi:V8-like Glu-specific endopeptidase
MHIDRLRRGAPMLLALAFACESAPLPIHPVQQVVQPVVYGEDDRLDVYAHPDEALRELTRQAIMSRVSLRKIDRSDPENFTFGDRLLGESLNLCEGARFADQVRAGGCSGTLVDRNTVLTAGHCIDDARCLKEAFVFDRFYRAEGVLETVTADDVYPCRRVLAQSTGELDYALVELDRRVTPDRVPVPIRIVEPLPIDTPLTMIGFPNGIPAKIDTGGRVIDEGAEPWVRLDATVDAFGGNSGSGIFDVDRALVAILVSGRTDYADRDDCRIVNRLEDDPDNAEDLVYVGRALDALCDAEPLHALCAPPVEGGTWCDACLGAAECRVDWICDGTCRPVCEGDDDCLSNHQCADGVCQPRTVFECRENQIWTVPACAPAKLETDCGADLVCVDGECEPPGPGDRCDQAIELAGADQVYVGQTADGFSDAYEGECGGRGPEVVYAITLDVPTRLIASATGFDTVLYLRRDCDPMQEIACNDDRVRGDEHALLQVELAAGTYSLFVDGFDEAGDYELDIALRPPCPEICAADAQRCEGDGLRMCAPAEDGCLRWAEPTPCGDAERCVDDACVAVEPGDACANPTPLAAEDAVIVGDLSERSPALRGTCGGAGSDQVFEVQLAQPTRLRADLEGDAPVLYVRAECAAEAPDLACVVGPPGQGSIDVVLPAGSSYLVVDTEAAAAGEFTLTLDFEADCLDCADAGAQDAGAQDAGAGADADVLDGQVVDATPHDADVADATLPDQDPPPDARAPIDAGPRPLDARAPQDAQLTRDAGGDAPDPGMPPNAVVGSAGDGCATAAPRDSGWAAFLLLLGVCCRRSGRERRARD